MPPVFRSVFARPQARLEKAQDKVFRRLGGSPERLQQDENYNALRALLPPPEPEPPVESGVPTNEELNQGPFGRPPVRPSGFPPPWEVIGQVFKPPDVGKVLEALSGSPESRVRARAQGRELLPFLPEQESEAEQRVREAIELGAASGVDIAGLGGGLRAGAKQAAKALAGKTGARKTTPPSRPPPATVPEAGAAPPFSAPAVKQPWEMTREEFLRLPMPTDPHLAAQKFGVSLKQLYAEHQLGAQERNIHSALVRQALSEGKPVPPSVLADYPDLAAQAGRVAPATAPVYSRDPLVQRLTQSISEGEGRLRSKVNAIGERLSASELESIRRTVARDRAELAKLGPAAVTKAEAPAAVAQVPVPMSAARRLVTTPPGGRAFAEKLGVVAPEVAPEVAQAQEAWLNTPRGRRYVAIYGKPIKDMKEARALEAEWRAVSQEAAVTRAEAPAAVTPPAEAPGVAAAPREAPAPAPRAAPVPEAAPVVEGLSAIVEKKLAAATPEEARELMASVQGRTVRIPPPREPTPPTTTGAPPPGGEPPSDPVAKITDLLRQAKPVRKETLALQAEERKRRAAMVGAVLRREAGEAGIPRAMGAMKGEFPKATFEPVRPALSQPEIDTLVNRIGAYQEMSPQERAGLQSTLMRVLDGELPTRGQIAAFEEIFGSEFAKALLKHSSRGEKVWRNFLATINLPRATQTAYDDSFGLRQGAVLLARNPGEWGRAWRAHLKTFRSDADILALNDEIRANPLWPRLSGLGMKESVLDPTKVATGSAYREENFVSWLADKIPGVKASQRGFVGMGNSLRSGVIYKRAAQMIAAGEDDKALSDLINYVNATTGRGKLPRTLREANDIFGSVFYSMRLQLGRFQTVITMFNPGVSPAVRTEAAKTLGAFVGADLALLTLGEQAGLWKMEKDPRSSNFMKAQIGNTYIDTWAGFQQFFVLAARLITGQRKTQYGNIVAAPRLETLGRFVETKFAPGVSLGKTIATGKGFLGEKVTTRPEDIARLFVQTFGPLSWQDIQNAVEEGGLLSGAAAASTSTLEGTGASTIPTPILDKLAQRPEYGGKSTFAELSAEQKALVRMHPDVKTQKGEMEGEPTSELRDTLYEQQLARDAALDVGEINKQPYNWERWQRDMQTSQIKNAAAREIQDKVRPILERRATNDNERALQVWFDLRASYEDKRTGTMDIEAMRDASDALMAGFTEGQRQYILDNAHPNATPRVAAYYKLIEGAKDYLQAVDKVIGENEALKKTYRQYLAKDKQAQAAMVRRDDQLRIAVKKIGNVREKARENSPESDLYAHLFKGAKLKNRENLRLARAGKLTFAGAPVPYTPAAPTYAPGVPRPPQPPQPPQFRMFAPVATPTASPVFRR